MYTNTEFKTAKSTQRKLSRTAHTDFTLVVSRHLFHFWEEIAETYLWSCYLTVLQISSLPGSQHHGIRDKASWLLLPDIHLTYGKAQTGLLPAQHIKQDGSNSQETKRQPGQVTSPLTQLGWSFLACRKSFAMGGTTQDVCGEPGAAGWPNSRVSLVTVISLRQIHSHACPVSDEVRIHTLICDFTPSHLRALGP